MANINTWVGFKKKTLQLLGGLFMEKNKDGFWTISLGRVSFWLCFISALTIWTNEKDISPNHLTMLLTLTGYNLGKKVMDIVNNVLGKKE